MTYMFVLHTSFVAYINESRPCYGCLVNESCDAYQRVMWLSVLQCVAVCCSVLQCVAVCLVNESCHAYKRVMWLSVLQCVAVCCSVSCEWLLSRIPTSHVTYVADFCMSLVTYFKEWCDSVCCSVLQCVAVCLVNESCYVYQRVMWLICLWLIGLSDGIKWLISLMNKVTYISDEYSDSYLWRMKWLMWLIVLSDE